MGRLIEASPLRIKDQTHKTALLQSKMASPRYDRADRERDRGSYEPVIHSPPKIMSLKCDQPVFGHLHPPRLAVVITHRSQHVIHDPVRAIPVRATVLDLKC